MRRRTYLLLALLLFVLSLAASATAVPILVELKIKDPVGAIDNAPPKNDDVVTLPGNNGKSNGKGKSGDSGKGSSGNSGNSNSNGKADLKSLTLWLSTDGKSWKSVSSDVTDLSSDRVTARLDAKGSGTTPDLMKSLGLPSTNITGETSQTFYVGLSTGSTSFAPGSFSARLVSWQYVAPNGRAIATSVPEPAIWTLFATGALGLGALLGGRKKA